MEQGTAVNLLKHGRIYLVGMPGCGKTTVSHLLGQRLGWASVDTDRCVERNSCRSIPEIFSRWGEPEFRKREHDCIRASRSMKEAVVACGGGAPCYADTMDQLLHSGIVIYLKSTIPTLRARLSNSPARRPLLQPTESLQNKLHELLGNREQAYARAHITIDTDHRNVDDVVSEILKMLQGATV